MSLVEEGECVMKDFKNKLVFWRNQANDDTNSAEDLASMEKEIKSLSEELAQLTEENRPLQERVDAQSKEMSILEIKEKIAGTPLSFLNFYHFLILYPLITLF